MFDSRVTDIHTNTSTEQTDKTETNCFERQREKNKPMIRIKTCRCDVRRSKEYKECVGIIRLIYAVRFLCAAIFMMNIFGKCL